MPPKKVPDSMVSDLFEMTLPTSPIPGSMDYRKEVSLIVSEMLKECPDDRFEIAAKVSRLLGREFSKAMLDAYAAESRETHNMPFYIAAAIEEACCAYQLTTWLITRRGGRALFGKDVLKTEIARLEYKKGELAKQIRQKRKIIQGIEGAK